MQCKREDLMYYCKEASSLSLVKGSCDVDKLSLAQDIGCI